MIKDRGKNPVKPQEKQRAKSIFITFYLWAVTTRGKAAR
jgi:hypothetical protein